MAISNLKETLSRYRLQANALNYEINYLQRQEGDAIAAQGDEMSLKLACERDAKSHFKALYEDDIDLQEKYKDYTEIPDFEYEIDVIAAEYTEKLNNLSSWESNLEARITTDNAELEENKALQESIKSMLTNNISQDFKYGLN